MMGVSFRTVVEDDFQAICDLMTTEEELFLIYAQGKYPLTVEQVRKLVGIRMEPTMMLHDGIVAGFGNFYRYRKKRSVFIGNIVVDKSLRGKGLGNRLVNHMIKLAFNKYDLPMVKIHVYNRNLTALLLYHALGFKPYAMKLDKDYKGDPVMLLSLRLSRDATISSDGQPHRPTPLKGTENHDLKDPNGSAY